MGDLICLRCSEPGGEGHTCPMDETCVPPSMVGHEGLLAEWRAKLAEGARLPYQSGGPLLPGHPRTEEEREAQAIGRVVPEGVVTFTGPAGLRFEARYTDGRFEFGPDAEKRSEWAAVRERIRPERPTLADHLRSRIGRATVGEVSGEINARLRDDGLFAGLLDAAREKMIRSMGIPASMMGGPGSYTVHTMDAAIRADDAHQRNASLVSRLCVPVLLRPIRVPAWEIHRSYRNPPARILLQWACGTGRDTRKGGGWLRRQWRRHAFEAPRDLVGEMVGEAAARLAEALAPLAEAFAEAAMATGAFADAMTEAATAWCDFGQALPSMGPDFTCADLASALSALDRPPYPTDPPIARTDDPELAAALRAMGADVRPAFVGPEVADGRPGCDYSVSVTAPGPLPAEEESDG